MDQKTEKKPNILIILTDQQNIDSIAAYRNFFSHEAYGCHWLKTPNIDKMVDAGYSFMESHSVNPVSCPARSCLMTGRYSSETGVTYNNIGIDESVPNMGQWFEEHSDYDRVYCGKWHAGGKWNYPDVEGPRKIPGFETLPAGLFGTGDYNDFQVSGAVRGYIKNHDYTKPFLVVAGLMNPHDICYWTGGLHGDKVVPDHDLFQLGENLPPLPPNFEVDFEDPDPRGQVKNRSEIEWRNYVHDYLRMVEKLDQDLGRMVEAVEGRKDQTLVVLTADHGEGAGRHKRVQKWHPFEQSVKVPLVFYLPGTVMEGVQDTKNIVSGVNLMPTVCDYAGIPKPQLGRGESLRNTLEGKADQPAFETAFMEFKHTARIVRHRDFKYVKYYEFSRVPDKPFVGKKDGKPVKFSQGAGRDKYADTGKRLLFNIREDPWEMKDLSKDPEYASKMEEMDDLLVEKFESVIEPGTHFDRN